MRAAAIGIGSNSLRMLVADIQNARLRRILRDRAGLRVFASLDESRNISDAMMDNACASVREMIRKARELKAERLHLFATSAVRDAANRDAFADRLREATGLPLHICPGTEEAMLSFLGACDTDKRSGVIDIGGGSTEICVGQGDSISLSLSLQLGAVRLFRLYPIRDAQEALDVCARAEEALRDAQPRIRAVAPAEEWFGVGGTLTTSAALIQNIAWTSKDCIHGYQITPEQVEAAMVVLAPMPLDKRLCLPSLQPQRADIVVHGMAILLACMRSLGLARITVSEYSNLEGYLKKEYGLV